MRTVATAFAACLIIGVAACATAGNTVATVAQDSEKALIEADDLYIAIATGLNAYEALPSTTATQKASAEAIKSKAYSDLLVIRQAYAAGQTITAATLAALQADSASASAAGATVAAPAT